MNMQWDTLRSLLLTSFPFAAADLFSTRDYTNGELIYMSILAA
jgi:hypothetical protein